MFDHFAIFPQNLLKAIYEFLQIFRGFNNILINLQIGLIKKIPMIGNMIK